ncbi:MAG: hypothetical protein K2G63_04200 [Oscillospiraceae bacterium]|nr:hypothetical protein [Oscillospiraceae bacterium]
MKATESQNIINKNPFIKARIRNNIITNKKLLIIISILHAIGYPLLVCLAIYEDTRRRNEYNSYYVDTDMFIIASVISGILALLAGFVVAMNTFKYQYKKSCVDMNLSLPLSSSQRFFTDYLTGLGIYLVPALCAWLIGDIIGVIGLQLDSEMMAESFKTLNICGVIIVIAMILFYTFSVFCITCCGSIFEAISSSVLINGVIPLFLLVLGYCICDANPYGIAEDYLMIEQICFTSPIGCVIFAINFLDDNLGAMPVFWSWFISIIIYTALILALSFYLYKKRKAEKVSKPYVYKFLYYILTSASLFIIVYGLSEMDNFFGAVFISAIFYFILEVITNRGFKKFYYSVFRFAGTVVSIVAIGLLSNATNGFGIYKYVPSPAGVSEVYLSTYFYGYSSEALLRNESYSDRNIIKAVTQLQKSYIEKSENYSDYDIVSAQNENNVIDNTEPLEIIYYMKNGNVVTRKYNVLVDDLYEIYSVIYDSDEVIEKFENKINVYKKLVRETDISFREAKTGHSYDIAHMTDEMWSEFEDAYKNDLRNMTSDDYYSRQIIGVVYINDNCYIRDNFTNTIAFLEKYIPDFNTSGTDFKLSEFAGQSVYLTKDVLFRDGTLSDIYASNQYYGYNYCIDRNYNRYVGVGREENISHLSASEFSVGSTTVQRDLEKLINVALNVYDDKEVGGVMTIGRKVYFIPVEYKELVNKVHKELFSDNNYVDDDYDYHYHYYNDYEFID